jgi:trk system potassium uptake protein TrkA
MRSIVVGGGKVGYYLARELKRAGHEVILIERDEAHARRVAEKLDIEVILGDSAHPHTLADARADEADVLAAVTGLDEENLLVCQIAKLKFGIKKVIARVNNPENEKIFKLLGLDEAVSSTSIIASLIEREIGFSRLKSLLRLEEVGMELIEVELEPNSPLAGKTIEALSKHLPKASIVATVLRDGQAILPRGDTKLEPSDTLLLLAKPEAKGKLEDAFGEKAR